MYEFSEIKDGKTLFAESNIMKHCAFSYIDNCMNGICSIWSMKTNKDLILKNVLTIEIQNLEVVQIRGKNNRLPTELELTVIETWTKENNFKFIREIFKTT